MDGSRHSKSRKTMHTNRLPVKTLEPLASTVIFLSTYIKEEGLCVGWGLWGGRIY